MPSAACEGARDGVRRNGVTVGGSAYRYVADLHPHDAQAHRGGPDRQARWPDRALVAAGAATTTCRRWPTTAAGGGLSADGKTLVLSRFAFGNPPGFAFDDPPVYPPRTTRLAILDTELRPYQLRGKRRAFSSVALRGDFTFDAISPDGSTIYLVHYLHHLPREEGPAYLTKYEVRAFDTRESPAASRADRRSRGAG